MQAWFAQNQPLIATVISLGTPLVWVFYAQLLLSTIRRCCSEGGRPSAVLATDRKRAGTVLC